MKDPQNRNTGEFPKIHKKALEELYKSSGVGKTAKQRHAYWNKVEPDTSITHVDLDDDFLRTKCFELSWLTDRFPQDFTFC